MFSPTRLVADDKPADSLIGYLGVGGTGTDVAHVVGFIKPDGTDERYPDFAQPNQRSWIFGPQFSDGQRIMLSSYEDVNLTKVRSGKVVTHSWIYDLGTGQLQSVLEKNRAADQLRPHALLPGERRVIETAVIGNEERIFIRDIDGDNATELTAAGGGFHYGLELSHKGNRLACHVTGGTPSFYNTGYYSINVFDLASKKRALVAGHPEHLLFGPHWSPDDTRLAYLDCHVKKDPAHFRADLCIGLADGTEHRVVTAGQTHWFGTPFGSNMVEWSPDGQTITYTRLLENSKSDMSAGGAQLCLLNPATGRVSELTPAVEGTWDFRAAWSPDGRTIAFARIRKMGSRELWTMNPDGSNPRRLTDGYQHKGADHFRWFRLGAVTAAR
jgi:TolB protein